MLFTSVSHTLYRHSKFWAIVFLKDIEKIRGFVIVFVITSTTTTTTTTTTTIVTITCGGGSCSWWCGGSGDCDCCSSNWGNGNNYSSWRDLTKLQVSLTSILYLITVLFLHADSNNFGLELSSTSERFVYIFCCLATRNCSFLYSGTT